MEDRIPPPPILLVKKYRNRFALVLVVLLASVIVLQDRSTRRWVIVSSLDLFYSNVDLFTESHPIDFGPFTTFRPQNIQQKSILVQTDDVKIAGTLGAEFGHEWLASPRLQVFRKALPFDVDNSMSVFELSEQVRQLAVHGKNTLPEVETDPLKYLGFAKDHRELSCRYFSVIYGAAAHLSGYTTRLLSLSRDGTHRDHAVTEIYVPELSKWILIDSDFNIAYRKQGVWLNAQELQQEWRKTRHIIHSGSHNSTRKQLIEKIKNITKVELVELGEASSTLRESNMYRGSMTGMNLELYEFVFYSNRNDYLTANYPVGHPVRSREYMVLNDENSSAPSTCPEAIIVQDADQLYWPVGRVRIDLISPITSSKLTAQLQFSTWTPNFKSFEYRENSNSWTESTERQIDWKLTPGNNQIEVRSTNLAGLRGETAKMNIFVEG